MRQARCVKIMDLVFLVHIRLGGREYLGVLDTGATISIVAKKILPRGILKNTMPTAVIRMGMATWYIAVGTVKWMCLWAHKPSPIVST